MKRVRTPYFSIILNNILAKTFLSSGARANVGTLPQDVLADILLYHVAPGRRYSETVVESKRIRTLLKSFLFQDRGTLTDNLGRHANIVVVDVEAANGIIHVIDAVILPYAA